MTLVARKSVFALLLAFLVVGMVSPARAQEAAQLEKEAQQKAKEYYEKAKKIAGDKAAKLRMLRDQIREAEAELSAAMDSLIKLEKAADIVPTEIMLPVPSDRPKVQPKASGPTIAYRAIDVTDPSYFENQHAIVGAELRNKDPELIADAIKTIDTRRDELLKARTRLKVQSVPATDPRYQEVERRLLGAEQNREQFLRMQSELKR